MMRTMFGKAAGAALALAVLAAAGQAEAGWRWHGSSGGSWGGYGSSGGWAGFGSSGGSWGGSSGGSWGGHWHHRHRWHGSSGGWLGWGSSGGSSGGYYGGSSGGWGSSGGSSGGAYYAPMSPDMSVPPVAPAPSAPAPGAAPAPPAPAPGTSTSLVPSDAYLAVSVPEDAKVFVNGQATTSTGSLRQYVSRDLTGGHNYTYEVRAEITRDGRTVEQVKKVDLRAGQTANLAFDFPAASGVETSLTLHVPADAKVYLAGSATKAAGQTRVFRTSGLTSGQTWEGYTVRVEVERGGNVIAKEETITLQAGQTQELRFDFDGDKIAAVR